MSEDILSLGGRVALVTGAGQGVGRQVAIHLSQHNCGGVAVNDYHLSRAEAVVEEIKALGGKAIAVQADVTKGDDVRRLVDATRRAFGDRIDILVNNAGGIVKRTKLEDMTEAFWDTVFALNTKSTFLVTQAVVPHMTSGGAIVNMASLAARDGGGGGSLAYAASKGAVLTMTRGLAKELGPKKIRVNCVSPGMIDTTFHDVHTPPAAREATVAKTLIGRQGTSDDVASAVLFLASEMSAYITGESVEINGGLYFI
jgi:3-oxoacyl-[acyl-carrier protein] reductase